MPTGGVTLDNAGDWIRAGAVAVGVGSALLDAKAIEEGRFDVLAPTRGASSQRRRRTVSMSASACPHASCTFGEIMLRLSPPGFERLLQSPVLSRRSAAAKPTSRSASRSSGSRATTSRGCRRTRSATRPSARCAPKASAPTTSSAAATASASTSPRPAPASAPPRSSTTARIRRSARCRRTPSTGTTVMRARRGSTSPASRRRSATHGGGRHARGDRRGASAPARASASTSTTARSCGPRRRRRR